MRKFFIFLTIILLSTLCRAAQTFTLDSYIQEYVDHSPLLVQEYNAFQNARLTYQNSIMQYFLPSAGAQAGIALMSKDTPGLHFDNPYDASVFVNWNLFNSGRDYLAFQKEKNNLEIARRRFDNILQNTLLQAITLFYELRLNEQLLLVAEADYKDKLEEFQKTNAMYKEGLKSYSDMLQSENNFKNAQLRREQEKANYALSLMAFNNKIGRGVEEGVVLDYTLPPAQRIKDLGFEADLDVALENREDVNSAVLRLQNSKIDNRLTTMNNLPMLTAGFGLTNTSSDIFGAERANATDYSLGLNLSVPIGFFWWDKYNEIKISRNDLLSSYMGFEELLRTVKEEISRQRTGLDLQYAGIEISENNLRIAKERMDIVRAKYNDGNLSYLEVSLAQDQYLATQIEDTRYKYNYQLAQYSYKRALGLDAYSAQGIIFNTASFARNTQNRIDQNFLQRKK